MERQGVVASLLSFPRVSNLWKVAERCPLKVTAISRNPSVSDCLRPTPPDLGALQMTLHQSPQLWLREECPWTLHPCFGHPKPSSHSRKLCNQTNLIFSRLASWLKSVIKLWARWTPLETLLKLKDKLNLRKIVHPRSLYLSKWNNSTQPFQR